MARRNADAAQPAPAPSPHSSMSGVAAIVRWDGAGVPRARLEAMLDAMAMRMPAGAGRHFGPGLAMAQCHFAAPAGWPPAPLIARHEVAGLVLAMDGWLANAPELRADLEAKGARLRHGSDAELALEAFAQWGMRALARLEGEFALVLWDEKNRRLLAARDHHGLRPLFWHCDGRQLLLASDLAAIHAGLGGPPPLNLGFVAELAADCLYSADETPWRGIFRVPAAHGQQWVDGRRVDSRYWSLEGLAPIRHPAEADYIAHYREVLSDSVRRAARTPLPLGCEVSGGLDSSAVFAIAAGLWRAGALPAPSLRGYTLAGPPGTEADEIGFARAVGEHLGLPVHEEPLFMPAPGWFAARARADGDLPPQPNAAMSIGLDRAAAADGCRVVLTGLGGDQWLDGTPFYYGELLREGRLGQFLACWRADARAMGEGRALAWALRHGPGSLLPPAWRAMLGRLWRGEAAGAAAACAWLRPAWQAELARRLARHEAGLPRDYRASYKLRKLTHPRWAMVLDQMARQRAHSGIELRHPMLSRAFISHCAATPEHIRLRGGVTKWVHRQALAGLLPEAVRHRRGKAEFSAPYHRLGDALLAACGRVLRHDALELFDPQGLAALLHDCHERSIYDWPTGILWGIYLCDLLASGLAPAGVEELDDV